MGAGSAPPKDGDLLSNMRGELYRVVGDATSYADGQWLVTLTSTAPPQPDPESASRQSLAERRNKM